MLAETDVCEEGGFFGENGNGEDNGPVTHYPLPQSSPESMRNMTKEPVGITNKGEVEGGHFLSMDLPYHSRLTKCVRGLVQVYTARPLPVTLSHWSQRRSEGIRPNLAYLRPLIE